HARAGRLERRERGRRRRRTRGGGDRHRRWRLDPHPRRLLRARRSQAAARTDPRPLRIAVSFKPALPCKLHPEMRAATERTVALLDELGHTTVEHDPDYGDIRPLFVPRYARGAYLDSERLGGPDGLEPRARSIVRIGKRLGKRADRAVAHEAERAKRINRIFD